MLNLFSEPSVSAFLHGLGSVCPTPDGPRVPGALSPACLSISTTVNASQEQRPAPPPVSESQIPLTLYREHKAGESGTGQELVLETLVKTTTSLVYNFIWSTV